MAREKRFDLADSHRYGPEPFVANQVIPNLRSFSPKQLQAPFHEQDPNKRPCFFVFRPIKPNPTQSRLVVLFFGSSTFSAEYQLKMDARMSALLIPKGLNLSAQGCEARATLGKNQEKSKP